MGPLKLHQSLQTVCPGAVLAFQEAREEAAELAPPPAVLLLCTSGRIGFLAGRQGWYFSPGDLVLIRTDLQSAPPDFLCGHFTGTAILLRPVQLHPEAGSPLARLTEGRAPVLRCDLEELRAMMSAQQPGGRAADLRPAVKWLCTAQPAEALTAVSGCADTQIRIAKGAYAAVWANCSRHIPISALAETLCVSTTHLKNSFRAVYGDALYSYVRTQKMLAAAERLRHTGHTVLEIAGEFGYDNGSKFARAFQRVMGLTPREFRRSDSVPIVSVSGDLPAPSEYV